MRMLISSIKFTQTLFAYHYGFKVAAFFECKLKIIKMSGEHKSVTIELKVINLLLIKRCKDHSE